MTHTGNGESLLRGGGGQKRTGAAEENMLQAAIVQLI